VSPPGTLNANGKLEAANTATVPIGTFQRRSSGRGGTAEESGASMTTPRNAPSSTMSAKKAELVGDAGELAGQPGHAEWRLRVGRFDQLRRARLDAISRGAQQR